MVNTYVIIGVLASNQVNSTFIIFILFIHLGHEFQAVFLSTAEPTDHNGMSKNPTKSPCGQYVFNTAITRAKSLVVCAGNPFLLLKIEEKMKNEQTFWRDYMKRCIIAKTFHICDSDLPTTKSITDIYKNLQIQIFSDNASNDKHVEEGIKVSYDDPIIHRLQQYIRRQRHYKKCKLQIYEQQQSDQIWKTVEGDDTRDYGEEGVLNIIEEVDCELIIKTQRSALGVPVDSNQKPIVINGLRNRRGGFHGDIVTVGVIGTHEETGKRYGKIIYLKEGRHPVKYVCRADRQSIINFYPLDKLEPAIVNLPKISRYTLQYKPDVFGDSQKSYITVFQESSLTLVNDDILPKVKELIPLEMASSLLFIVKVLSWSPRYRKPLGAVIEALPRTTSMFITEKLLIVAHDIQQHEDDVDSKLTNYVALNSALPLYNNAFTIDPKDAENLDDALSITHLSENTFKMSVLITNVAKHIKQDSILDKSALHRGTSVYGLQSHCSHMLPLPFTRANLSLLPEQCRDVLVISAIVKVENGKIADIEEIDEPENAQMKSVTRLTYEEAQRIFNGEEIMRADLIEKKFKYVEMKNSIRLLFEIAMKFCIDRIGDAAYYHESDPGEENNWQSHLLVSELMIWANKKVAKYLNDNIPDFCILRRQLSPLPEELITIQDKHKNAFILSMSLESPPLLDIETIPELLIPLPTCAELKDAYDRRDFQKLRNILSDDSCFPQLAIALSAKRSISRRAEYIKGSSTRCDDMESDIPLKDLLHHHGLNLDYYTHFTSPIRRYPDIIIQRLVNALLDKSDVSYTEDLLKQLCTHFNRKLKSAAKFERDVKRVELATLCEDSLDKIEVYLTKSLIKEHQFELCIPSKKYKGIVQGEDTNFDVSQLNCLRRKGSFVTWRVICLPFESLDFLFKSPNISKFDSNIAATSDSTADICANIFSILEGEGEGENSYSQRRKKISYTAKIQDKSRRMDLDTWKQCNEFVKQYSLLHQVDSSSLSLLECALPVWNCPEIIPSTNTPIQFLQSPVICYDVTRKLDIGETVTVWMGKSITKPISSPGVHLIEVASSVIVCLEHNKSPAMCFSDIQLRLTSKSSYRSAQEYVDLWSKALLAEASCDAVNTETLVMLKDAPLKWPELLRPNNYLDNVHFKPKGSLSLVIDKERLGMLDFILKVKIRPGDLVCARYRASGMNKMESPSELCAVYHFVIQKVESDKKNEKIKKVLMKPVGEHGCLVSLPWLKILKNSNPPPCELQIIKMPDSFKLVVIIMLNYHH